MLNAHSAPSAPSNAFDPIATSSSAASASPASIFARVAASADAISS
jgi:hypothetical protein